MTPLFIVQTSPHFERFFKKLRKHHPELPEPPLKSLPTYMGNSLRRILSELDSVSISQTSPCNGYSPVVECRRLRDADSLARRWLQREKETVDSQTNSNAALSQPRDPFRCHADRRSISIRNAKNNRPAPGSSSRFWSAGAE